MKSSDPVASDISDNQSTKRGFFRLPQTFSSLDNSGFRYLWFGQFFSASAMHADMVARGILVWQLTGSSTAVGGVLGARAVPMLIIGLFGGVAADRFNRKNLLIIIQFWALFMHAIMAILLFTDLIQLWHVFAIAIGLGISTALNQPVRTTVIPELVKKDQLTNALMLNSIAINSTRLIGPALIAMIIATAGIGSAYLWSSVAYLLVILSTTRLSIPSNARSVVQSNPISQLLEGFKFILGNRAILILVGIGLGPLAIGFAYQSLLPQLVSELGHDTTMIGYIMSVGAIGGLAGGLTIASKRSIETKGKILIISGATYALALMGFTGVSALGSILLVFPIIIIIGVSQTTFRAMNNTLLIEVTPAKFRGRVIAATLLDTGLMPVAALVAGFFADGWGVWTGFLVLSSGCLAVILLAVMIHPKLRQL